MPLNSLDMMPEKLLIAMKNAYTVPSNAFGHNFAAMIANGKNDICPIKEPTNAIVYRKTFVSICILSVIKRLRSSINANAAIFVAIIILEMCTLRRKQSKNIDANTILK